MVTEPRSEREAFGLAIRIRRERLGLSQEALSALAHLHRTYIGSVERGERNVSLKNIYALTSALGTTPAQLLAEAEALRCS
ncbi:helix-turn-helix domain-containing protein [Chloroflexota bacterium]